MATYHLTAKIGKKGMGEAHAAYISREGKYSEGKRYEDLEAKGGGNMPEWAEHNPAHFWNAADEKERANGSVYREIEIALPREFTPEQRLELVQEFIKNEIADKHAYQFAIHIPKAALEKGEQPHAHIMYSERIRDGIERDPDQYFKRYNAKNPEKGGAKKFRRGDGMDEVKEELVSLRERWATLQNKHLEQNGHNDRVDHRSLKDRGIDREPEMHLGGLGVRKTNQADIKALLTLRAANTEHEQAKAEVVNLLDYKKRLSATPEQQKEIRETAALEMARYRQERADNKARDEKAETARTARLKDNELRAKAQYEKEEALKRDLERTPEFKQPQPVNAQVVINRLIAEERDNWRKLENERLLTLAEKLLASHKEALTKEPKSFFGGAKWKQEHKDWVANTNQLRQTTLDTREAAKKTLEGKSDKEQGADNEIRNNAAERLKNEYPEIYQTLVEKKRKAELEAKAIEREKQQKWLIEKSVSDFKTLAVKRESKSFGFRDDGKRWNALPSELKTKIETYNELSPTKRGNFLNDMKEKLNKPDEFEKLKKQLDKGKEQGQEMQM